MGSTLMQQTVIRKYATPTAFQAEFQQLASRGWCVRGVDRAPASKRSLVGRAKPSLTVTYEREELELKHALEPEPSQPWFDFKVPSLASRWAKALAAAGVSVVILGFVIAGRGGVAPSVSAQGISIQALGALSEAQLPKDPQANVYTRDLNGVLANYGTSLTTLSSLTAKPQMSSGAWHTQLSKTTVALHSDAAILRALTPPACLSAVHGQLLIAVAAIDKATQRVDGGLSVQSTTEVTQWAKAASDAGAGLKDAASKLAGAVAAC